MRDRMRSGRGWIAAIIFTWCSLFSAGGAAEPAQGSLRLVVQPERPWVVAGAALTVHIGLHDAHDQPVPAPSDFVIALATTPAVPGARATVTIATGQSAATLQLQPATLGMLQIHATHPQAFEGGAFVRVTRHAPAHAHLRSPSAAAPGRPEPATALPAPAITRSMPPRLPEGAAPAGRDPDAAVPAAPAPATPRATVTTAPPAPAVTAPQAATAPQAVTAPQAATAPEVAPVADAGSGSPPEPRLELYYNPQRPRADETVKIQAFLSDDAAPIEDLKVTLFVSTGTLSPLPLVVHGISGESTLTTDQPGDVEVEFKGSQPPAEIEGKQRIHIHFSPPIRGLKLEVSPAISLVEEADLLVTLVDGHGTPVKTDEPRTVVLALDEGRGEIVQKQLILAPGELAARTQFVPTDLGTVRVSAASESLLNQTAQIGVRLPLGRLALSVIGGLAGGWLAFLRRRAARWTRVAAGGVTGFVLYWAFIFGLMRVMPHAFVLNPLSSFALSVIGGWLGTEVFALLLNRLGLDRSREDHGGKREETAPESVFAGKERAAGDGEHAANGGAHAATDREHTANGGDRAGNGVAPAVSGGLPCDPEDAREQMSSSG